MEGVRLHLTRSMYCARMMAREEGCLIPTYIHTQKENPQNQRNTQMEYDKKLLTALRVKLNSGVYSESWYREHFKGMIDCIESHLVEKDVSRVRTDTQKISDDMKGNTEIF